MSLNLTQSAGDHSRLPLSQSTSLQDMEGVPEAEEEETEPESEDFSFVCLNPDGSAEDGPVFPLFNRDLLFSGDGGALRPPLRKVFVEESTVEETAPAGPYCEWTARTAVVAESSPGPSCKKSNSTGFSKLWRLRESKLRSNSDGKNAFVFLSESHPSKDKERGRKSEEKHQTAPAASKHRSYLPYRHVGLFADVNGLTRNLHPF